MICSCCVGPGFLKFLGPPLLEGGYRGRVCTCIYRDESVCVSMNIYVCIILKNIAPIKNTPGAIRPRHPHRRAQERAHRFFPSHASELIVFPHPTRGNLSRVHTTRLEEIHGIPSCTAFFQLVTWTALPTT
jgi:hypothetical protein